MGPRWTRPRTLSKLKWQRSSLADQPVLWHFHTMSAALSSKKLTLPSFPSLFFLPTDSQKTAGVSGCTETQKLWEKQTKKASLKPLGSSCFYFEGIEEPNRCWFPQFWKCARRMQITTKLVFTNMLYFMNASTLISGDSGKAQVLPVPLRAPVSSHARVRPNTHKSRTRSCQLTKILGRARLIALSFAPSGTEGNYTISNLSAFLTAL